MCAGAIWQVGWSTSPHLSSCENQTPGKKEWAEEMGPHWIPNRFVYVFTLGWNRNLIDAGPRAGRMLDRKKHSLEGGSTRTKRATTFVFYRCWAAQKLTMEESTYNNNINTLICFLLYVRWGNVLGNLGLQIIRRRPVINIQWPEPQFAFRRFSTVKELWVRWIGRWAPNSSFRLLSW